MAAYEYVALDGEGREQRGTLEADSTRQLRQLLRDRGWAPLSVEASAIEASSGEAGGFTLRRGLSAIDLAVITRQLATLVQSGMPVEEALQAVAQQSEKRRIRAMVLAVRARILEGHGLAVALGEFPNAFSEMYRATIAAGEHSGHLAMVLGNLAEHCERREQSGQGVQSALVYPVALVVLAILIVMGLMVWVVPDLVGVIEGAGQELPLPTVVLIAVSEFLANWWWLLGLLVIAAIAGVQALLRQPAIRLAWHRRLLGLPLFGRVSRGSNAAQFANTLSILNASGVPLVDALRIAGQVLANTFLRQEVTEATRRVSEGESLSRALTEVGHFPPLMLHMVASGELSGQLDTMLARVAEHQQRDLDRLVSTTVSLLQPLALLVMGGLVLGIVMAMILPILNFNQMVA